MTELGILEHSSYYVTIKLQCIGHNSLQYDRTKHVEIVRHFIKEKLHTVLSNQDTN